MAIKNHPGLAHRPKLIPGENLHVVNGAIGYFICNTIAELTPIMYYCHECHRDTIDPKEVQQCECEVKQNNVVVEGLDLDSKHSHEDEETQGREHALSPETVHKIWKYIRRLPSTPVPVSARSSARTIDRQQSKTDSFSGITPGLLTQTSVAPENKPLYDATGGWFWCPARALEDVTMDRQASALKEWKNHILLCILAQPDSHHIGLDSFIWPLRSSTIRPDRMADIVILTNPKFMRKEWHWLQNIPRLTVVDGDALNRVDLRAASIKSARMVVIMAAPTVSETERYQRLHSGLADKEVIMATQNVRDMSFSEKELYFAIRDEDETSGDKFEMLEDVLDWDKTANLLERFPVGHLMGTYIPVITMLRHLKNCRYLDLYSENPTLVDSQVSHPFACGRAFSPFIVDALSVITFFNPGIYGIFNTLMFGGLADEVERITTEGAGLLGGEGISQKARVKHEVIVRQIPLGVSTSPLHGYAELNYGALVLEALLNLDYLCLGIYRRMNLYDIRVAPSKRIVICNPPKDFILHPTDLVFCLLRLSHDDPDDQPPRFRVNETIFSGWA